ncbi:MAG TPA: LuxR C-terminal-related transcriptional regulator [Pseudonocardia sp.]|nr:LuxR C-terminal-related transcriptional regulator [Pseudonocardia sp.]
MVGRPGAGRARTGGTTSRSHRPSEYRQDLTTFVGRHAELRRIRELISEFRLVSIVGIGGVGKTRLAKEAIGRVRRSFRDGVYFVDFTSVRDEALLEQVVRDSVPGAPSVGTLIDQLTDRTLLLVLDNCEHVLDRLGPLVSEVMAWCPGVRILATSRRPLGISGEYILSLSPLGTSAATPGTTESALLFRDRASAAGGQLSDPDLAAVDELCARLEGVPLAIELAATRTRTMTVPEIIAGLDDRFALLRGGPRDIHPRHQSLDAMLRWSWEQCSADERRLWTQLSLFAGPAPLRAIVSIRGRTTTVDTVDTVDALVQQMLLIRSETAGEATFGMLEMIREYGRRRLDEGEDEGEDGGGDGTSGSAGTEPEFRERHLGHFREFAAAAQHGWFGPSQRQTAQRLTAGIADFRLAFEWALGQGDRISDGEALFADLWLYWVGSGHLHEARIWAHQLWARLAECDRAPTCRSLWTRGWVSVVTGDIADAREQLRQCLERAPAEGTARDEYTALGLLAACDAIDGNYPVAVEQYAAAIDRARAYGHPLGLALILQNFAEISTMSGDFEAAEAACDGSEELCLAHGEQWCYSHVVWVRSVISYLRGEFSAARDHGLRALKLKISVEDQLGLALTLEVLAWTAAARGDHTGAAVLLGGTEPYWGSAGAPLMGLPRLIELRSECLLGLSEVLGPAELRTCLAEGAGIGLERLPAFATGLAPGPAGEPVEQPTGRPGEPAGLDTLTAREREVALLLGDGMSNREIAAKLVIGQRTVETHVARVLAKLGARRRSEVGTLVARSGRIRTAKSVSGP